VSSQHYDAICAPSAFSPLLCGIASICARASSTASAARRASTYPVNRHPLTPQPGALARRADRPRSVSCRGLSQPLQLCRARDRPHVLLASWPCHQRRIVALWRHAARHALSSFRVCAPAPVPNVSSGARRSQAGRCLKLAPVSRPLIHICAGASVMCC